MTDDSRMQMLLRRAESKERFDTGLKFSTEKISETGLLSDLHDRYICPSVYAIAGRNNIQHSVHSN